MKQSFLILPHRCFYYTANPFMEGVVIKNTGNQYLVRCTDGTELYCMAKGNLRLKGIRSTNPVAVGDRVEIVLASQQGQPAYIRRIHP